MPVEFASCHVEAGLPTYEYRCRDCGEHLEVVQSFRDDPLTDCPACGGSLRKVFGAIGITFKGSGFYKTDSRAGASGGKKKGEGEASTASSTSSDSSSSSGSGSASSGSPESSGPSAASGAEKSASPSSSPTGTKTA